MNLEQPKSNNTEFLPTLPTREEILQKITEHLGELKYEITKELTDERGVYFIEILTTESDPEGYIREIYLFQKIT
jgi:hypothetical protein